MNTQPQPTTPAVVYNNGNVAIGTDLVFEYVVYAENGWIPLSFGDKDELRMIQRLMDNNPIFPRALLDYVQKHIDKAA